MTQSNEKPIAWLFERRTPGAKAKGGQVGFREAERVETEIAGRGVWRCHILKLSEAGPHTLFPRLFEIARPEMGRGAGGSYSLGGQR